MQAATAAITIRPQIAGGFGSGSGSGFAFWLINIVLLFYYDKMSALTFFIAMNMWAFTVDSFIPRMSAISFDS